MTSHNYEGATVYPEGIYVYENDKGETVVSGDLLRLSMLPFSSNVGFNGSVRLQICVAGLPPISRYDRHHRADNGMLDVTPKFDVNPVYWLDNITVSDDGIFSALMGAPMGARSAPGAPVVYQGFSFILPPAYVRPVKEAFVAMLDRLAMSKDHETAMMREQQELREQRARCESLIQTAKQRFA